MKRVLQGLGFVLLLGLGLATALLVNAHRAIRDIDPPLPELAQIAEVGGDEDLPISLRVIVTAAQAMPRSAVLEPDLDPDPEEPYVMAHPSFVLEWEDGRLLLIDAGMGEAAAEAFGPPLEWASGAAPIVVRASAARTLGEDSSRVAGIVFTHLHVDHVDGIGDLCSRAGREIAVFQGPYQAEHGNYTTRGPRELINEAGCAVVTALDDSSLSEIPGFPGVRVLPAAGHTPGSQIVVVHLRAAGGEGARPRSFVFTGDVVNHAAAVEQNLPKPHLYSLLVVPESTDRLARLRVMLGKLAGDFGLTVVVSHDQASIDDARIPAWR